LANGGNIKANLRKLNFAQISGILYSAVMLGVLLPKLNILMTKGQGKKDLKIAKNEIPNKEINFKSTHVSMEKFVKGTK
jgi:hypothetical protein